MDREAPTMADAAVVELRQYTVRPGTRDDLVEVFEAEFIETQEAEGMRIGGIFRDRDDPDQFVWFRGFADLTVRRPGLEAFYTGPAWKTHGGRANATMLAVDNVLLLRPTVPPHPPVEPAGREARSGEWVVVEVYEHPAGNDLDGWLATEVHAILEAELGVPVATWRTEPAVNDFPALPVRETNAFVWTAVFVDRGAYAAAGARLDRSPAWQQVSPRLGSAVTHRQRLRLEPTARSAHPPASRVAR